MAELLTASEAQPVQGDLSTACLAARAEMLVARHLTSIDLVKQAVPHHIDLPKVRSIVAAIGTGPHVSLVAETSSRLSTVLEVPGMLLAASPDDDRDRAAQDVLDHAGSLAPELSRVLSRATDAGDLAKKLPAGSLLVLGAPGGSWLQRKFFGPGRRLAVRAPAGALVVRDAPTRCYQRSEASDAFGVEMRVADALRLLRDPAAPVARNGTLVGIVRRPTLLRAHPDAAIETVMEQPVFVRWDAPVGAADELRDDLGGAPVPVVGPHGELIGSITG